MLLEFIGWRHAAFGSNDENASHSLSTNSQHDWWSMKIFSSINIILKSETATRKNNTSFNLIIFISRLFFNVAHAWRKPYISPSDEAHTDTETNTRLTSPAFICQAFFYLWFQHKNKPFELFILGQIWVNMCCVAETATERGREKEIYVCASMWWCVGISCKNELT